MKIVERVIKPPDEETWRSVRVSMGAALTVPCARSADWPGDLEVLKAAGFSVLALTPDPDAVAVALDEVSYGDRVALMLGAEGSGLTAEALAGSSLPVKIPMMNNIDSLNVAAAAAVAFYAVQSAQPRPSRAFAAVPRTAVRWSFFPISS
jgi:tRNA G18 (ribose-2'-O)-methylase SpoU